jgi:hypothetical protein
VIYEYEVPGGALNLKSTKYPDHGRQGDLPLQGKIPMDLGTMYGPLIVHMPPATVHRTFVSAFKGTKNLISLPLDRS